MNQAEREAMAKLRNEIAVARNELPAARHMEPTDARLCRCIDLCDDFLDGRISAAEPAPVHPDILKRYDDFLSRYDSKVWQREGEETTAGHLRWMLAQIPQLEVTKAHRWLAWVQAVLILKYRKHTVDSEREFTRPYFAQTKPTED